MGKHTTRLEVSTALRIHFNREHKSQSTTTTATRGQILRSMRKEDQEKINPLNCQSPSCSKVCHSWKNCSKIGRYQTNKIWFCNNHNPAQVIQQTQTDNQALTNQPPTTEKLSCSACKGIIKTRPTLKCNCCNNHFHKQTKCLKLTRDTVDNIMKSATPTWTYTKCLERQERDYNKEEEAGTKFQGPWWATVKRQYASCNGMQMV